MYQVLGVDFIVRGLAILAILVVLRMKVSQQSASIAVRKNMVNVLEIQNVFIVKETMLHLSKVVLGFVLKKKSRASS